MVTASVAVRPVLGADSRARHAAPPRRGAAVAALALLVFFAEAVLLQRLGGAYVHSFGAHPDEAAHFVTSLMMRDFLAGGRMENPLSFAQSFYLHYPRVAIGHWPPGLYGALGLWMFTLGASRASALLFMALVAAAVAVLIHRVASRYLGPVAGWFAGTLFVALPLVQESTARVMTEHLVTFLMLAAALAFARFQGTVHIRDGLLFGGLAAAAILTRGSAWALALVPPIAIGLTRQWALLRRPGLWLSTLPVLITCVPWYGLMRGMGEGAWAGASGASFFGSAITAFSSMIATSLGWVLLLPGAVGLAVTVIRPLPRRGVLPAWAVLVALAAATLLFQCAVPASVEERFMVTVMPSLILLAAAGVVWLVGRVRAGRPAAIQALFFLLVAAAFMAETFTIPTRYASSGYEALVRDVAARVPAARTYLVAADSRGEGSLVAAVAVAEPRPRSYVLRGSKILVREDWLGRGTRDRFGSVEDVRALLVRIPVDVVVMDRAMQSSQRRAYHDRVLAAVHDDSTWARIGTFSVTSLGRRTEGALQVYVRRGVLGSATPTLPDVKTIEGLMADGMP